MGISFENLQTKNGLISHLIWSSGICFNDCAGFKQHIIKSKICTVHIYLRCLPPACLNSGTLQLFCAFIPLPCRDKLFKR